MDPREQEIRDQIEALCIQRYGAAGDENMRKLFESYDKNGNGSLNQGELSALLADADVGNFVTRGFYVDGVFEALDVDPQNGEITWDEYKRESSTKPVTPPAPLPTYNGPPSPYATLPAGCDAKSGVCRTGARVAPRASSKGSENALIIGGGGLTAFAFFGPVGGVLAALGLSFWRK